MVLQVLNKKRTFAGPKSVSFLFYGCLSPSLFFQGASKLHYLCVQFFCSTISFRRIRPSNDALRMAFNKQIDRTTQKFRLLVPQRTFQYSSYSHLNPYTIYPFQSVC